MQVFLIIPMLIVDAKAEELNLSQLSRMVLQLLRFSPFLEGDLDIVIRFNGNKISVLIPVPQPHGPPSDGVVRKSSNLGINSVNEGLVGNVERHDKSHVIPIAIHFDFQLRWECHAVVSRY